MELKKEGKFEIWEYGGGHYRVVTRTKTLAKRVNRLLKQYEDYTFLDGEEPVFKFTEAQLPSILKALQVGN
jgi:hypothetical protein